MQGAKGLDGAPGPQGFQGPSGILHAYARQAGKIVKLPGGVTTLASMHVPPGTYLVWGEAQLWSGEYPHKEHLAATCELQARGAKPSPIFGGASIDADYVNLPSYYSRHDLLPISVMGAHTFTAADDTDIDFVCANSANEGTQFGFSATDPQLMAVQVTGSTPAPPASTSRSGSR